MGRPTRLAVTWPQDLTHGIADDPGHIRPERADFGLDAIKLGLDAVESFLGSLLEFENTPMDAFDLFHQKPNVPLNSPTRRFRSRISASTFMLMAVLYHTARLARSPPAKLTPDEAMTEAPRPCAKMTSFPSPS